MPIFAAMLRAINVGGRNPVSMASLRELAEGLGYKGVRTYLQSGNLVFGADSSDRQGHAARIRAAMAERLGLDVAVMVRSASDLRKTVSNNPFKSRTGGTQALVHASFLSGRAPAGALGSELPLAEGEEAALAGDVVYLYLPLGYGNSRMNNAFLERRLGLAATTRNWRSVCELERMTRGAQPAS